MKKCENVLGVDIGAVSITYAAINRQGELLETGSAFHHGRIKQTYLKLLKKFDLSNTGFVACTSSTPEIIKTHRKYNNTAAAVAAIRHLYKNAGSVLNVGGESFSLTIFDEQGHYRKLKTSGSCAAGTGSFLDQQARRLKLNGIEELAELAYSNTGRLPEIATRCAVFAKTDLVHAQQEGFAPSEICDGLCRGLAANIVDVLFSGDDAPEPVIFTGGAAKNKAVVRHLANMLGKRIIVDKTFACGAVGAALCLLDEIDGLEPFEFSSANEYIWDQRFEKKFHHPPLEMVLSNPPDFSVINRHEHRGKLFPASNPVEVELFEEIIPGKKHEAWLGLDIGSTSTKAVLIDRNRTVLFGFYTRTAGRPVQAVRHIFEAIDCLDAPVAVIGAGTTGSGRKLAGKIIGADLVIDEITAHARAACEIDPLVDTIIEIGGQDSKFTTLKDGAVTFSVMNHVCAAGTGSFIEEQAEKLGCPLSEYSARADKKPAPLASDRCTVFMEKDLNHLLSKGFSVDEILAAVLHSVCENYLTRVAVQASIGDRILFQGATAKNRALIAALEQKLEKPIRVSKFCHLTGAMGAALCLSDNGLIKTSFRGLDLHKKSIPMRSEVCSLCHNACKLVIAEVDGENVGFGFLCGRDYDTNHYVNNNRSGFDLIKRREKIFYGKRPVQKTGNFTIGLPYALHMAEEIPFWQKFFDELSIPVVDSRNFTEAVKSGKKLLGSEFCAPMASLMGHIDYLTDKADYVFTPFYLERKSEDKDLRRQYCYFTQYAPALASAVQKGGHKLLSPLIYHLYNQFYTKIQLYRMMDEISSTRIPFIEISNAWSRAMDQQRARLAELKNLYIREKPPVDELFVVLLGRPYTVLSRSMNKNIPDIFASLGIKTFFQDMLDYTDEDVKAIRPLLGQIKWHYASGILEAAEITAKTPGAYPVLITSFKCTPDSFVIEYFKDIMTAQEKPHLILQLDEHDSSVGYETRIEAAVRSFRNHHERTRKQLTASPEAATKIETAKDYYNKTLFLPNWDDISIRLMAAGLQKEGIDARILNESDESIRRGLVYNTGQCTPLSVIAGEFIDSVNENGLNPEDCVLWTVASSMACNLGLFAYHLQWILNNYGRGFEKAGVYAGALSFIEASLKLPMAIYFALMFGGLVRKMGCKIRPYEKEKGKTDQAIEKSVQILEKTFLGKVARQDAVAKTVAFFEEIETHNESRPKVAIFGDLYVRDNEVMNQGLVRFIEENGGEVVTTPYTSLAKMIAPAYKRKWLLEGLYLETIKAEGILLAMNMLEKNYYKEFQKVIQEPNPEYRIPFRRILEPYNVRVENSGESLENLIKLYYLVQEYPDISLFVQTSPAYCCPSMITEAMAGRIEEIAGVPVASINYDGIGGAKNEVIIPYLKYPKNMEGKGSAALRQLLTRAG